MKKILRQYHKIFPRKFANYWKKNKSILNIDNDLKEIISSFVLSESYNFVSKGSKHSVVSTHTCGYYSNHNFHTETYDHSLFKFRSSHM